MNCTPFHHGANHMFTTGEQSSRCDVPCRVQGHVEVDLGGIALPKGRCPRTGVWGIAPRENFENYYCNLDSKLITLEQLV